MKYFITLIFSILLSLSFAQKIVYTTETLSMSTVSNGKAVEWTKESDVNIVAILDIDSSGVEVERKMLIFSAEYKEFVLGDFEFTQDDKGNYLITFLAYDVYGDRDCKVSLFTTKKKSYLVVEYDDLIVKYRLYQKYSISIPKTEM